MHGWRARRAAGGLRWPPQLRTDRRGHRPWAPDHGAARLEFAEIYGDEVDPADFRPTPFNIDEINSALHRLGANPAIDVASLPVRLGELLREVRSTDGLRRLRQLIAAAELASPVQVDLATAERMVRPYAWLLDRVGSGGIKLTDAGYLPPVHVSAAFTELGLGEEWIGQGNREADTWPVLQLRESAQKLGLLRKRKGELLQTSRGRAVVDDPLALWWHLAERMPVPSGDPFESQAGLLFLVAIAGGLGDDVDVTVAHILGLDRLDASRRHGTDVLGGPRCRSRHLRGPVAHRGYGRRALFRTLTKAHGGRHALRAGRADYLGQVSERCDGHAGALAWLARLGGDSACRMLSKLNGQVAWWSSSR